MIKSLTLESTSVSCSRVQAADDMEMFELQYLDQESELKTYETVGRQNFGPSSYMDIVNDFVYLNKFYSVIQWASKSNQASYLGISKMLSFE